MRLRLAGAAVLAVVFAVILAWVTAPDVGPAAALDTPVRVAGPSPVAAPAPPTRTQPRPRPKPTAKPSAVVEEEREEPVQEDLPDNKPIHDAIRGAAPAWAICYANASQFDPDIVVDARATWRIENGVITEAAITEGEVPEPLENCLLGAVEAMRLPPGTTGDVTWPFRFGE